jgi:hypothetical protein
MRKEGKVAGIMDGLVEVSFSLSLVGLWDGAQMKGSSEGDLSVTLKAEM